MKVKNMNVELPYYHVYNENMHALHGGSTMMVFIKNYESKILKIFAQAMVLALLITVLPGVVGARIISHDVVLRNKNMESSMNTNVLNKLDSESLPLVLHDLANEGLISTNDKSLIMSNSLEQDFGTLLQDRDSFVISPVDLKQQGSISDDTFDFSLTNCFAMVQEFIDRTLKLHGIVAVQLNQDPSMAFEVPSNYKIVYFRRFIDDSTYVVMRKTTYAKITAQKSTMKRKLLEFLSEEKKAVLGNLEDVLLEPPRSTKGTSKSYLKKTKFLPDLLNDSLDGYSRRVYIDVGGGHGSTRWFEQHYPTRNKDFDIYRIQTVPETEVVDSGDDAWEGPPTQMGISDWLWRNVKAEEYVVMKADVEVVEEMLKSKAIVLVDELFLECKPFGKGGRNKRAYWECLALYGRLRDFGVAVHQWWG